MPKGQYQRRSRETGVAPTEAELVAAAMDNPFYRAAQAHEVAAPAEIAEVARDYQTVLRDGYDRVLENAAKLSSGGVPGITRESFNDWLDADAVTLPPNDRFTQMVGEWAASFCDGEHSVTWLPSFDRTSLTVTLVTPYGTSELVADAGQWREADIAEALASMRVQLGV